MVRILSAALLVVVASCVAAETTTVDKLVTGFNIQGVSVTRRNQTIVNITIFASYHVDATAPSPYDQLPTVLARIGDETKFWGQPEAASDDAFRVTRSDVEYDATLGGVRVALEIQVRHVIDGGDMAATTSAAASSSVDVIAPPVACVNVSVAQDATYCLTPSEARLACGVGAGDRCPTQGAITSFFCGPTLASWNGSTCVLPRNATCKTLSSGGHACVLDAPPVVEALAAPGGTQGREEPWGASLGIEYAVGALLLAVAALAVAVLQAVSSRTAGLAPSTEEAPSKEDAKSAPAAAMKASDTHEDKDDEDDETDVEVIYL
ncbi:Aste57867_22819 [Aphanomyces stellatus]|uniref:Aste57867_22819 protein n=1 Tax=Aphanomyces stellatus TaxID=120398 RepID=A0A485LLS9_9STRA|nr:hypothetical protein As57867_022749 [Aphanomyces stellatus]VFT99470.1 Aste57867_22819 [Aphanomyces stellatus]